MKLLAIVLDDNEMPTSATVSLTQDELALICCLTGRTASLFVTRAGGDGKWGAANEDIAGCVSGFFNRFWYDGIDAVAPPGLTVVEIAAEKLRYQASQSS